MPAFGYPLIHNLSIQRQGVLELLQRMKQADLRSEVGFGLLASLQVRVLFHLRVEDELLVAVLDSEAKQSPDIARIMDQWTPQLRCCANQAQAFFQKWLVPETRTGNVREDWQSLKELLEWRMDTSERLLYPAYRAHHRERLRKAPAATPHPRAKSL